MEINPVCSKYVDTRCIMCFDNLVYSLQHIQAKWLKVAFKLAYHWSRYWLLICLAPRQYPSRRRLMTNWIIRTKLQWNLIFLRDWPWISPWIKSISNELDIAIVWSWWRHQQSIMKIKKTERVRHGDDVKRSSLLSSFMDSLCRVRNRIMYVLSWGTVSAFTRVLFWYLFHSLLRNSGNTHQNSPFGAGLILLE